MNGLRRILADNKCKTHSVAGVSLNHTVIFNQTDRGLVSPFLASIRGKQVGIEKRINLTPTAGIAKSAPAPVSVS